MKKTLFRIAALMMGALVVFACKKSPKPSPDDPNKDKEPEGQELVCSVDISIDGDFSDWDQVTAEAAGKDDCLAIVKATSSDPIPVIKTASDALNVYVYAEILVEALPQNAICHEWGDSYNGAEGFKGDDFNDGISTSLPPFNLFFDPDGKEETGFFTYADSDDPTEPAIPGLGCEMCAQNFFFFNPETMKLGVAWNQVNIGPLTYLDAEGKVKPYDYNGEFFQQDSWKAEGVVPNLGWQNSGNDGTGDNIAPRPENIMAVTAGRLVKVEFAIEKIDIVGLTDDDTRYAWGVCFRNTSNPDLCQDIGPIRAAYSN
ncbi:MAG: hypothetical protein IKX71_02980 [Bacteroidales bacterium]|nr:hypothetical protein [Bacteroidales bacterium]